MRIAPKVGNAAATTTTRNGARSLPLARAGVKTDREFAGLMSALMSDLIEGNITPAVGNAAVNAGGKLLKVVEMRHRYGSQSGNNTKTLALTE